MPNELVHTLTAKPDLLALLTEAKKTNNKIASINWRSQQVVDGQNVSGVLIFLDDKDNKIELTSLQFSSLLAFAQSPQGQLVTPKTKLKTALTAALTIQQVKAVVNDLIDEVYGNAP